MSLHDSLFREYDVRGVYPSTLNEASARAIGAAFARKARETAGKPGPLCIGRDGRKSSPALTAALIEGIGAAGGDVLDIGIGPTPMLYYAVCTTPTAIGGIMVTGSHNPPDHNGFKFMLGKKPFFGEQIRALGRAAQADPNPTGGKGDYAQQDFRDAYTDALLAVCKDIPPMNVAWDAGNGATGEIMTRLTAALPGTHIPMYAEIDGTFPNHHPDPTVPKNLEPLIAKVRAKGCDLGLAFDGDGDRIGAVDCDGEIVWGDQLLALYAADILARKPGSLIIADVKASQALFDEVTRLGGTPLMWKTGHSHIKAKMLETGAPVAGEMSGHMFFADGWYGFDDGLYAGMRLLALVARSGKSLKQLRLALPKRMATPELRFASTDSGKFAVIESVKARLRAAGARFSDVDGVRVQTPDGWWLLRASNTQAILSARCEADDAAGLERLRAALHAALEAAGVAPVECGH